MRVFLSYRRDDGIALAKLIKTKLLTHPKIRSVFLDIDDLGHDQPFPDRLRRQIARADMLLALIGPHWEGARADGVMRIQQEGDWVRAELGHAMTMSKTRLVPVLLEGRPMPQALPENIAKLADSNAIALRTAHFDADIEELARKVLGTGFVKPPSLLRR
jgi:hypothetical protein